MKIKLKILLSIVLIYTDSLAYEVEDQEFDRTPIPCSSNCGAHAWTTYGRKTS